MPTQDEIGELLAFLPIFTAPDYQPVREWHGGKAEDGVIQMAWPDYDEAVNRFSDAVHKDCWLDGDYVSADVPGMLHEESRIERATLDEIRTLLTFCVRGDRFCEGHLGDMIEAGHVTRILRRLAEIVGEQTT
ncbi:MAG: DUF6508 domain-containing protein [Gammaproteobacteria bacterium]